MLPEACVWALSLQPKRRRKSNHVNCCRSSPSRVGNIRCRALHAGQVQPRCSRRSLEITLRNPTRHTACFIFIPDRCTHAIFPLALSSLPSLRTATQLLSSRRKSIRSRDHRINSWRKAPAEVRLKPSQQLAQQIGCDLILTPYVRWSSWSVFI